MNYAPLCQLSKTSFVSTTFNSMHVGLGSLLLGLGQPYHFPIHRDRADLGLFEVVEQYGLGLQGHQPLLPVHLNVVQCFLRV